MPSTGFNSPGTLADDNAIGTVAWSNPSNAASSNDSYATYTEAGTSGTSHYLKATNFSFNVPVQAVITGVEVKIEKSKTDHNWRDNTVKLVVAGSVVGSNKATADDYSASDTVVTYGSGGDLWGVNLSPGAVNASNFGVVLATDKTAGAGSESARVDHIQISVHYQFGNFHTLII